MEESWVIFQVINKWQTTTLSSWLNAHSPWLFGQLETALSFCLHSMRVKLMGRNPQTAYRYGWSHSVVDRMFVEAFGALTLALQQSLSGDAIDTHCYASIPINSMVKVNQWTKLDSFRLMCMEVLSRLVLPSWSLIGRFLSWVLQLGRVLPSIHPMVGSPTL